MVLATVVEDAMMDVTTGLGGWGIIGAAAAGVVILIWYLLLIIGDLRLFTKAGIPGWHSLVPFLNIYQEYDICWTGSMGIVYSLSLIALGVVPSVLQNLIGAIVTGVLALLVLVLRIVESVKLSAVFGHGIGYAIFMILFERLGRLILGLGRSEYEG